MYGWCAGELRLKTIWLPCTGHTFCPVFSGNLSDLLHLECTEWCIYAKVHNSHKLSVSGASVGNMKGLSCLRSITLLRIISYFPLLLSVAPPTIHFLCPYHLSMAALYKCEHLWKMNLFSLFSSSHATQLLITPLISLLSGD